MRVALFVPCYVDQFYPRVAIAALEVLERLGVAVAVPEGAVCCGQPPANAGYERDAEGTLHRFERTYAPYDRVVVLSGSCAVHVKLHAAPDVADRAVEFSAYLHDEVGLDAVAALGAALPRRVGVHIGCHGLRGLGLAQPSELQRPDECCGFGGTFAVSEPAISAKMGRDRLRDYDQGHAEAVVSTDVSCLMHLAGLARRAGSGLPMLHVAEVLAGTPAGGRAA